MRIVGGCLLAGLALFPSPASAAPKSWDGVWVAYGPNLAINLLIRNKYGVSFKKNGVRYCGGLSWLKPPRDTDRFDDHNPDPSLRTKPLLGLIVLPSLVGKDDGMQELSGDMYFWLSGANLTVRLRRISDGEAELHPTNGSFSFRGFTIRFLKLKRHSDAEHKPQVEIRCPN